MTQPEYEQKKRECWEEYWEPRKAYRRGDAAEMVHYDAFSHAFDRAYALGKQTQIITEEEIEKEAEEYADKEHQEGIDDWGILYSGYYQGMKDALGKQTETITQEEIKKAAEKYSQSLGKSRDVTWNDGEYGFIAGANFALGKQEKGAEDTVIQGWVARDDGERWHERELHLFTRNKPERRKLMGDWIGRPSMMLDSSLFPDLTWDSNPEQVEIIIKRKKK